MKEILNNNNHYNNINSYLFYLCWHNIIIKNQIIGYLKIWNYRNLIKKYYYSYSEHMDDKYKFNYGSVVMKNKDGDVGELVSFIKRLPGNIKSLEFSDTSTVNVNIVDLVIPDSLKEITSFDKIYIGTNNQLTNEQEIKEIQKYSSIFNHLIKFKLPNHFKIQILPSFNSLVWLDVGDNFEMKLEINYLPSTLLHLRLGKSYRYIIEKGSLPSSLKSLSIASDYPHSTIGLPSNLKSFCFERGVKDIQLSILKCIPDSVEELYLYGAFTTRIDSFANLLPTSLKRFKTSCILSIKSFTPNMMDYINIFNNGYTNGFPSSLTYLDVSSANIGTTYQVNPTHLSNLKVLKLRGQGLDSFNKGEAFPETLTSIECDSSLLGLPFKNPNNIESFKVYFTYPIRDISFSKFPNIKSIKAYSSISFFSYRFNPSTSLPASVTNLEMITYINPDSLNIVPPPITFPPNNNIKSLKLDHLHSYSILKQSFQSQQIFIPSSCLLLDLNFNYAYYNTQDPPSLSLDMLPSSLKVLVLRGSKAPKLLLDSSTGIQHQHQHSLEVIFISDQNKTYDNHSIYSPIQIITFNETEDSKTNRHSNSILYRKLKKYINK